ncbi:MAG: GDSL family lipase, partial [Desertifilum sp. SIO1I2]|nr:GDSL family lipase [Desertifilum sp. SIO1I2]
MAVKIMPLGDSNTRGHNQAPAGYRNRLWNLLSLSGFEVDFVGSQVTGTTPTLSDLEHEGRGGWRIDQISDNVTNWLNQQQPDIVLLMIGTNDILQQYQVNTAPNRLNTLIDQILDWSSNVQILVGSIIPITRNASEYQQVLDFNSTIPGIVNSKNSQVQFIDIFSAVSDQDLTATDNIHPTEFGYNKIAQAWYDALISSPTLASTHSETLPIRIEAEDYINYYDTTPNNQGGQYRTDGVDIQVTSDVRGGYNVAWTAPGEWLAYEVNVP